MHTPWRKARPNVVWTLLGLSILVMTHVATAATRPTTTLANLPLTFEPNRGQASDEVRFLSRGPGYLLQLTATEIRLLVKEGARPTATTHALRLEWLGANAEAHVSPQSMLPGKVNYIKGSDPSKWHTSIPTYQRVRQEAIYPGIDLVYYGNGRQLEYDLIVAPRADPTLPRLAIEGARVHLTKHGDLDVNVSDGRIVTLKAPVAYQERSGKRFPVKARYRLFNNDNGAEVSFQVGSYDRQLPLIIDPLLYSTFLGASSEDDAFAIAVNAAGEAFVTGNTFDVASAFPTTPLAFDVIANGDLDVFVTRVDAGGTGLIYSTFLGGDAADVGWGIAVNSADEAYVIGETTDGAIDFPTTVSAYSTAHNGAVDAFVTRLNAAGDGLVYSTLLGGTGDDLGFAIALGGMNDAFVTGYTTDAATDFPIITGAFDPTQNGNRDVFVTRLKADGRGLIYSTFLGGSGFERGHGIAVNGKGDAFVTGITDGGTFPTTAGAFSTINAGRDAFVTRLNAAGSALVYSTYLGGSAIDNALDIALSGDDAFVTGYATSGFPTTVGAFDTTLGGNQDAFVTRLNATGSGLIYSTLLGGDGNDLGWSIAVNSAGDAFVTGSTADATSDFPTTVGAFDSTHNGLVDAFVTRLNATGSGLVYSTLIGGSGGDSGTGIAVLGTNNAFVSGYTTDNTIDFPTTAGAFDETHNGGSDAFVAKVATQFVLDITGTGSGNGTITATGINCTSTAGVLSGDCTESFAPGTAVTLTPIPAGGSTFGGWTAIPGTTADPDCIDGSVTMNTDRTCTALFIRRGPKQ